MTNQVKQRLLQAQVLALQLLDLVLQVGLQITPQAHLSEKVYQKGVLVDPVPGPSS